MEIGNIIPYALTIAGAALTLWWRIELRCNGEREERERGIENLSTELKALITRLSTFELDVAKNFVPAAYQDKMETRFISGIDRLTSRLEVIVARIEGMGNQLTRIDATVKRVDDTVQNGKP